MKKEITEEPQDALYQSLCKAMGEDSQILHNIQNRILEGDKDILIDYLENCESVDWSIVK